MSEHPGVFIDETPGPPAIEGVPTSTAGIVGPTERGPDGAAQLVRSWPEFAEAFGGLGDLAANATAYAVAGFFENGGRRLFVARVTADYAAGLRALEAVDEVSILTVPNLALGFDGADQVREALIEQCERLGRFAVLGVPQGQTDVASIVAGLPRPTAYAAVYYPDVRVAAGYVTPVGHVAGVYARVDAARGVWQAPANQAVLGLSSPEPLRHALTDAEQEPLNERGVDVIRDFTAAGRGVLVWGARTLASDPEWRYVNVRRLGIFLEHSIDQGTQWVVFEPNAEATWSKVRQAVEGFVQTVWRDGALAGRTASEAFFVRCDRTTMTADDIAAGRLVCLVGFAPVRPAEFVLLRITQLTADAAS